MEIGVNYLTQGDFRHARDMGCKWAYVDFRWDWIQPEPGVFIFDRFDSAVKEAEDAGLLVIGAIATLRAMFPDKHWCWRNARGMMPDLPAWRHYLEVLTKRYSSAIHHWEVWSEPNCRSCNPISYYDPGWYLELLALASQIIRRSDSSAQVVIGGLWPFTLTPYYLNALLSRQPKATEHFDIFNWHFYLMTRTRESIPFCSWKPKIESWIELFRSRLPEGRPIWMTEFGLPTAAADSDTLVSGTLGRICGLTEGEQAEWFSEFAQAAREEWDLGTLVFWRLQDREDPKHSYASSLGLLRTDGSAKPIVECLRQFAVERSTSD